MLDSIKHINRNKIINKKYFINVKLDVKFAKKVNQNKCNFREKDILHSSTIDIRLI